MARSRSIPTKLFWDPDVSELDSDTQIVLIGMTLEADDWGRGRAHVGFLARACNKAPAVIERALQQLEDAGLIRCYQVGRHRYYVQCRWQEWETLSNPTPSNFPAPPSDEDLPRISPNSPEFPHIPQGISGDFWETPPEGEGEGEEKRTEEEEEGEAEGEAVSPGEPPASPTSSSTAISRCENTRTAGETVQQGRYAPRGSLPFQGDPVPGSFPDVPGGWSPPPAAALCRDGPPDRGADRAAGDQAHPAQGVILSAQRQEMARSPGAGKSAWWAGYGPPWGVPGGFFLIFVTLRYALLHHFRYTIPPAGMWGFIHRKAVPHGDVLSSLQAKGLVRDCGLDRSAKKDAHAPGVRSLQGEIWPLTWGCVPLDARPSSSPIWASIVL